MNQCVAEATCDITDGVCLANGKTFCCCMCKLSTNIVLFVTVGEDCDSPTVNCAVPAICSGNQCLIPCKQAMSEVKASRIFKDVLISAQGTCLSGEERYCVSGTVCEDQICKPEGALLFFASCYMNQFSWSLLFQLVKPVPWVICVRWDLFAKTANVWLKVKLSSTKDYFGFLIIKFFST